MSKDIFDIHEWDTDGVPTEFAFGDNPPGLVEDDERWKDTSLPNIKISNLGRVYNTKTNRIKKPTHGDDHGHQAIKTSDKGKKAQAYYHRLLAEAFIPNPKKYPIVRHLDDNPDNNDIDNLAWGTQKDNHNDAVKNNSYRYFTDEDREKSYKKSRLAVKLTDEKTGKNLYFQSIAEASKSIGAKQANLSKVLHGKRSRTLGYSGNIITKEEYDAHSY